MKKNNTKAGFQGRVKKLVYVNKLNPWNTYKNSMLQACDEVCEKKKVGRYPGDTWWWNEEMKEAIQQKNIANKKWHIKRCAKMDQGKLRLDIRISKIKQESSCYE